MCLSEQPKKATKTLQEKIKDARDNENGSIGVILIGLLLLLIAYIVGIANILIAGSVCLVMATVGIAGFFYYRDRYDTLMKQIIMQMQKRENHDSNAP